MSEIEASVMELGHVFGRLGELVADHQVGCELERKDKSFHDNLDMHIRHEVKSWGCSRAMGCILEGGTKGLFRCHFTSPLFAEVLTYLID